MATEATEATEITEWTENLFVMGNLNVYQFILLWLLKLS